MGRNIRWFVVFVAVLSSGCASDAGSESNEGGGFWGGSDISMSSGGYGKSDTKTAHGFDIGKQDAGSWYAGDTSSPPFGADTGSQWGRGASDAATSDAGASPSGTSDAGATPDAGPDGGSLDDAGGQSWQQQSESPPVAQVSLGGGKTLKLVSMRVAVRIEGLRARVLVDHIFENPFNNTIEGTFRYTLPPESEVSYYATFQGQSGAKPAFFGAGDGLSGAGQETIAGTTPVKVAGGADVKLWGVAKEARVQRHLSAALAYDKAKAENTDPALVEAVAPNTFQAKVFPIPANGYNRVMIAWEQTLPSLVSSLATGQKSRIYEYVFPVPQGFLDSFEFTLLAKKTHVTKGHLVGNTTGGVAAYPPASLPSGVTSVAVQEIPTGAGYLAKMTDSGTIKGGKLAFHFAPKLGNDEADVLVGTDPVLNKDYATLRLRPKVQGLAAAATSTSAHAVFLLDTSRSSHPDRFGTALKLMNQILTASPGITHFNVIPFDSGASWLDQTWVGNTPKGRADTQAAFGGLLLEGATDFGAALRTLAKPTWAVPKGTAVDVFLLTDGAITWGEQSVGAIVGRWQAQSQWNARFFAYRLGVGAENLQLFSRLTANNGAIFDCLSAAVIGACSKAHKSSGMKLTSVKVVPDGPAGGEISDLLIAGRMATLYPGASLTLAGPLKSPGKATVQLEGITPGGTKLTHNIKVDLQPAGQLAPRAWANIAITQLLDSGDKGLEGLAMALSQHYRVANRIASFLVLAKESAYDKYNLTDESKKFQGQPLAKIIAAGLKLGAGAFSSWARTVHAMGVVAAELSSKLVPATLMSDLVSAAGKNAMEIPPASVPWAGMPSKGIPQVYLDALANVDVGLTLPFATEAERRRGILGDIPAAIRALSTSIERNPGNDEMTRLAAYRMASWGQTASAAELLFTVLMRRPFEPQSWRDLANTVAQSQPSLAIFLYEVVLAGTWDDKWKTLKTIIKEEYALFAHALVAGQPTSDLAKLVSKRIKTHKLSSAQGDLWVTVTWNTNETDIDLWVTTPSGEKCYYKHKKLSTGGELLDDLTQGYGPERFAVKTAMPGNWKIHVHYYKNNGKKLIAHTWVNVTIVQDMGKASQTVSHHTVLLKKKDDVALVETINFK
ncbi:MAG: VWA domain-containing protein [Myxococcales bacterium]|nr:VWA domain-containing protein [Myxococcales bacterium]